MSSAAVDDSHSGADDIAPVMLGPSRGNDRNPTIYTKTATGAEIEMSELMGSDPLGVQGKPVSQTLMENRIDFHTHPRSLGLAHMQLADWRTHEKLRTLGALLVVCLNLGTDPPDLVRPVKRSVLEAWVDPTVPVQMPTPEELALQAANNNASSSVQRSAARERTPMKAIGENLLRQFEGIQSNAKYKPLLDCAIEDLRKACTQFRRGVREERLLFYYNGHGVPRPTASGDIWVFNRQFTQYVPVNSMELMSWVGTPCIYVWDCSHAMNVVQAYEKNAKQRESDIARIRHAATSAGTKLPLGRAGPEAMSVITSNIAAMMASQVTQGQGQGQGQGASQGAGQGQQQQQQAQAQAQTQTQQQQQQQAANPPINPALINLALLPPMHHEDIHFAATRADELLPTNPELPADLFTSCLTTPIKVALRFWVIRNPQSTKVTLDMCDRLPGTAQERRTPFGELNWIFTSITDTIAWSTLPRDLFRRLFRQDIAVAALYRNFMLADRIMRFYGVHPQCSPAMPPTHRHPLWDSLDLEIDMCLQQLPRLLKEEERRKQREERAKRTEQDRMARMSTSRGGQRFAAASNGRAQPDLRLPVMPKLAIAGAFSTMSSRHGARIGLGGALESDDDDECSGDDSDTEATGAAANALGIEAPSAEYISSTYFSNQLYAFEVWLQHAATVVSQFVSDQGPDQVPRSLSTEPPPNLEPPNELPAVLQVLLSQLYRVRALILLYRFMNLGPWAVDLAMAVGIFPYMSKLLASTTTEFREILILVWARLSAVDMALHPELLKGNGFDYFINYLSSNIHMQYEPVNEKVRLCDTVCAASAFTLTMLCRASKDAQKACFDGRVLDYFLLYLRRPDNGTEERACLRVWILLCLAELWKGQSNAKWMAMTYKLCVITSRKQLQDQERAQQQQQQQQHSVNGDAGEDQEPQAPSFAELLASSFDDDSVEDKDAQDLIVQMAFHRSPAVRASAIYAANTLLQNMSSLDSDPVVLIVVRKAEARLFPLLMQAALDGSPMVRREVAQAISSAVFASYMPQAIEAVSRVVGDELRDQRRAPAHHGGHGQAPAGESSEVSMELLVKLYKVLLKLSTDPHPDVALVARESCDILMQCYAHSHFFFEVEASLDKALHRFEISRTATGQTPVLGFLRSAGSVGDALLGYPPINGSEMSSSRESASSVIGRQSVQPQQQHRGQSQRQQQPGQRRLSAYSNLRGSPAFARDGSRSRGDLALGQNSVPSHRYTMHFTQQQQQQQQQSQMHQSNGRQNQSHAVSPRSPSAAGSVSASSLHALEGAANSTDGWNPRDRFAGLSEEERIETQSRLARVETAWIEWGRRELRTGVCESTLIDWAGAHFTEFDINLFANVSGSLQSSAALVESRERNRRVDRMEAGARTMSSTAGIMKWADLTTVAMAPGLSSAALLHPLEPHVVVASRRGVVSVFDWEMHAQVAQYAICSRSDMASAVCSLHLINPLGQAKLLVGSADGMVRVFASHAPDFTPPPAGQMPVFPRPRLLTAFAALPWATVSVPGSSGFTPTTLAASSPRLRNRNQQHVHAVSADDILGFAASGSAAAAAAATSNGVEANALGCGLVTAWNQRSGVLFAGGNDKEIRVWDINTEMCIEEISVSSMGEITCVSHDGVSGNIFAVGNGDGVVRVVDRRLDSRNGVVANWRDHGPYAIRNVFMRPGQIEVVSASANGDVKYWDLRHRKPTFTLTDTHTARGLEHMIAHENAPVTLTASDATVKLWNQRGKNIGVATAEKHAYGSAALYMKSLYGAKVQQQQVRVTAVAMHAFLPVAVMVGDDGRVSYIQPCKRRANPS
ncbi:Target of rapamycin complex 1 subunit kog1 [Coemansia sp. RSA 1722]|nr:Target of rapamycin complex 1 subunit kog1 [Coemansia sp. RSA 485]KAJ2594179.1 Target of rapamycin complex 1 subunit kog1 [Coemansia sp. RSA 1722]